MNIELKNFKHYSRFSEETVAFDATLYVEGKKVGTASNRGTGGPNDIHTDPETYKKLCDYAKSLPPDISEFGSLPMDLDFLISRKVSAILDAKEDERLQKRHAKKAAEAKALGQVFYTVEYANGTIVEGRCAPAAVKVAIVKAKAKYGENGKEKVFA